MKAIVLILSLFLWGCSNDDSPKDEPNNIPQELIGKWKTVAVYATDGASEPQWRDEDTGAIYDYWFKSNGEYVFFDGISSGVYSVNSENYLTLTNVRSITYSIESISNDSLLIDCLNFEPLKYKYVKVSSECK